MGDLYSVQNATFYEFGPNFTTLRAPIDGALECRNQAGTIEYNLVQGAVSGRIELWDTHTGATYGELLTQDFYGCDTQGGTCYTLLTANTGSAHRADTEIDDPGLWLSSISGVNWMSGTGLAGAHTTRIRSLATGRLIVEDSDGSGNARVVFADQAAIASNAPDLVTIFASGGTLGGGLRFLNYDTGATASHLTSNVTGQLTCDDATYNGAPECWFRASDLGAADDVLVGGSIYFQAADGTIADRTTIGVTGGASPILAIGVSATAGLGGNQAIFCADEDVSTVWAYSTPTNPRWRVGALDVNTTQANNTWLDHDSTGGNVGTDAGILRATPAGNGFALPREINTSPTPDVTCNAANAGVEVYVDDTDDVFGAEICVCVAEDSTPTYDWKNTLIGASTDCVLGTF
jgi:hypothetical protein